VGRSFRPCQMQRCFATSIFHTISMRPARNDQRTELGGVGAEFIERHGKRDHGARGYPVSGPYRDSPRAYADIGLGRAADVCSTLRGPSGCTADHAPPQCDQPAFDRHVTRLDTGRSRRLWEAMALTVAQRVLDAVVQLFENELLQFGPPLPAPWRRCRLAPAAPMASIPACSSQQAKAAYSAVRIPALTPGDPKGSP